MTRSSFVSVTSNPAYYPTSSQYGWWADQYTGASMALDLDRSLAMLNGYEVDIDSLISYFSGDPNSITFDDITWFAGVDQAGTVIVEATLDKAVVTSQEMYVFNARVDGSNRIEIGPSTSTPSEMRGIVRDGAVVANIGAAYAQGQRFRFAFAYAANDSAASFDGAAVVTDNSVTLPTGVPTIAVGNNAAEDHLWDGTIHSVAYYPVRKSNVLLQKL